jgi:hypothetical protein
VGLGFLEFLAGPANLASPVYLVHLEVLEGLADLVYLVDLADLGFPVYLEVQQRQD